MTNPNLPSVNYAPENPDVSHLRVLSIFFYILAGLQALGVLFGLVYIGFGLIFGAVAASGGDSGAPAAATGIFGMFACFGIFFILLAGTFALLNFKAAQGLRKQKNHTLCFVMAIIICLSIPLGTILGVFTLIALSKPQVKALFT